MTGPPHSVADIDVLVTGGDRFDFTQAFTYDAFGRRLDSYPTRRETPVGFVDWAPWKRTRKLHLYGARMASPFDVGWFRFEKAHLHRELVEAYAHLSAGGARHTDVVPLLKIVRERKKYGLDRIFQGEFDLSSAPQKEFILRIREQGGWARVLNLDPHTALFLQKAAGVNNAASY